MPEFSLTMLTGKDEVVVTTPAGNSVFYKIENNYVIGAEVVRTSDVSVNVDDDTRKRKAIFDKRRRDAFNDYLECTDAVLDQASAWCGGCGAAKVAFIAGCGYVPVCSGAYIVTCSIYAYTEWIKY